MTKKELLRCIAFLLAVCLMLLISIVCFMRGVG